MQFDKEYYDKFCRHRRQQVPPGLLNLCLGSSTVLDIGCGNGYVMKQLVDHKINATGVDISEIAISLSVCRDRCSIGDARSLPYQDKAFDVAFSLDVFEHIAEYTTAVTEMIRVSKRSYLQVTTMEHRENLYKDPTHVVFMSNFEWMKVLQRVAKRVVCINVGHFILE